MNIDQNIYSKESIKARMMQNASELWGVKNPQSLDPFVKLLMDAFSTEIFKVNNEVQNVNGRILEKMSRLLTPTKYTHPAPASAVAVGSTRMDFEILPEHAEFYFKKQVNSLRKNQADKQIDIPFTPADFVKLVNVQTASFIAGNTVYSVDERLNKIPVSRISGTPENYRKIFLGIDFSNLKTDFFPDKLTLYCSNPTYGNVDFVYELLPHIKAKAGTDVLEITEGIEYEKIDNLSGIQQIFEDQSLKTKIAEGVKSVYRQNFIQISGFKKEMVSDFSVLPAEIAALESFQLEKLVEKKKILWLTFEFPPQFTPEILDNFNFVINAFPVYNRGWRKTEYSLDIMGNNIPLECTDTESFLYVDEVADGHGRKYKEIPFTPTDELSKGLYTVRRGGMERFSQRNATDAISDLLELVRDEVAAFSVLSRDNVKDVLSEMSSKMKGLSKKVENSNRDLSEVINYVILEPIEQNEHTFASFWVTNGSLANNIRPGTLLNSQKKSQNLIFLTESKSGDEEQKGSDSIQAFRYALTTRDKIVSVEDVKNFCKMHLRTQLKNISVKRGTIVSNKPKEGFVRTVNVEIVPMEYDFYGKQYWDSYASKLQEEISNRAVDGVIYQVKIVEK